MMRVVEPIKLSAHTNTRLAALLGPQSGWLVVKDSTRSVYIQLKAFGQTTAPGV